MCDRLSVCHEGRYHRLVRGARRARRVVGCVGRAKSMVRSVDVELVDVESMGRSIDVELVDVELMGRSVGR